jgi:hypothetical protein
MFAQRQGLEIAGIGIGRQVPDADVAEAHRVAVILQRDVAGGHAVAQVVRVGRIVDVAALVESDIVVNVLVVQPDVEYVVDERDAVGVPLSGGVHRHGGGLHRVVYRAAVGERGILAVRIKDLDLEPGEGGVARP